MTAIHWLKSINGEYVREELIPRERSGRGRSNDPDGYLGWVDDFEGRWPNIEEVDGDRLVVIRKKTVEATDDPILLMQQPFAWYWEDQLRRIDGEMRRRELAPD